MLGASVGPECLSITLNSWNNNFQLFVNCVCVVIFGELSIIKERMEGQTELTGSTKTLTVSRPD